MRRFLLAAIVSLWLLMPAVPTMAQSAPACQFILGFATLHSLDPTDTGNCTDNQVFAANGDAQQHTTTGLMVWRKLDNWTAFTNGYWTWINGPNGLAKRLNTQRFRWEANPTGLPVVDRSAVSSNPPAPPPVTGQPSTSDWCCVDASKVVLTLQDLPPNWAMKADEVANGVFYREMIGPECCIAMPADFLLMVVHPSATSALSHSEMQDRRANLAHPAPGAVFPPPCDSCGTVGDESIILGPDSVATTIAYARVMDARLAALIASGQPG